jgi:hypothetical protein
MLISALYITRLGFTNMVHASLLLWMTTCCLDHCALEQFRLFYHFDLKSARLQYADSQGTESHTHIVL